MEYVSHINDWHWGRSIEIVAEGCIGKVDMSFEKDNPGVCYLSGLSVLPKYRRHGVATELLSVCARVGELMDEGRIFIVKRGICPVTGFGATFITANKQVAMSLPASARAYKEKPEKTGKLF